MKTSRNKKYSKVVSIIVSNFHEEHRDWVELLNEHRIDFVRCNECLSAELEVIVDMLKFLEQYDDKISRQEGYSPNSIKVQIIREEWEDLRYRREELKNELEDNLYMINVLENAISTHGTREILDILHETIENLG